MDPLPPIPTPAAQRWREFRIQVLPLLVFLCILLAVALMWRNFVQPSGVVGQVEAIQANVISLQDGEVTKLLVSRFDTVVQDQELGHVTTADPDFIAKSLGRIRADLKLLQARMNLDEVRNDQSYEQLKMDLLGAKVDRELAFHNMIVASNQLRQTQSLFDGKIESPLQLEIAKATFEGYRSEMENRGEFIKALEKTLADFQRPPEATGSPSAVDEAIRAQEAELQATLKPTTLKAPIDGVVSIIYRRAGEKVVRGEPILVISAPDSNRIVGYVRQPVRLIPTTNDTVIVSTRNQKRQIASAPIIKVGTQMEMINPALLSIDSNRVEFGLPILVTVPAGMNVVPGEFVDLSIRYSKR